MRKALLLICFSLLSSPSFGAVIFDYKGDALVEADRDLPNLLGLKSFEGKHFKIVDGKYDRPISFDSPMAQRAAQVYYHLEKARDYFIKMHGPSRGWLDQQIIVRLDISNHFNPYSRFSHDEFRPESNTAVTIPGSGDERLPEFESWGPEIWFRPAKMTRSSRATDAMAMALENNENMMIEGVARSMALSAAARAAEGELLKNIFSKDALVLGALSFGLIKSLPSITRFFGRVFQKRFYLDTAMVPEIIYHEYAHFALAEHLDLVSTPVIEGLANYYAGRIANKEKWGDRPRSYSRDVGRDAYSKVQYSFAQERKEYATSSFVFKLLWSTVDIFENADNMIYACSRDLGQNSNIKRDLVDALFREAERAGAELDQKIRLHALFQKLGL